MRLITILLSVISLISNGQRVCDLEAHILLPDSGNLFESPGPNTINMIVVNKGPDALTPRDWIAVGVWVQGHHLVPQFVGLSDSFLVNDTFFITNNAKFLYKVDAIGIDVCINRCYAWTKYSAIDTVTIEREGDSSYLNNSDCVNGDVKYTLGIDKVDSDNNEVVTYPNPTSNWINFNEGLAGSRFIITNSLGQRVTTDYISSMNRVNVSGLKNGIYYITVFKDGSFIRSKFIVSRIE